MSPRCWGEGIPPQRCVDDAAATTESTHDNSCSRERTWVNLQRTVRLICFPTVMFLRNSRGLKSKQFIHRAQARHRDKGTGEGRSVKRLFRLVRIKVSPLRTVFVVNEVLRHDGCLTSEGAAGLGEQMSAGNSWIGINKQRCVYTQVSERGHEAVKRPLSEVLGIEACHGSFSRPRRGG